MFSDINPLSNILHNYQINIALSPINNNVNTDLPFETILACGATCRTMLHAMPLLTKISIDESYQMNLAVASRFRDITEIHINSLLSTIVQNEGMGDADEYTEVMIDFQSRIRVVPFLSRFAKLNRVVFGGKTEDGNYIDGFSPVSEYMFEGDDRYPDEGERECMLAFLDLISGGFQCGALPKHLEISGLCCPDATNRQGMRTNNCETCLRACKNFPLKSVVNFECRGSSSSNARSGRMYGLDVCLERAQIESIIESRQGGHELLRSEDRLLRLLGSGKQYKFSSDESSSLYMVKYKQEELDEIKRVIAYAEIDVKKISSRTISSAIMRSFSRNGSKIIPPKEYRGIFLRNHSSFWLIILVYQLIRMTLLSLW